MNKRLFAINIIFAVLDTIVVVLAILGFWWCAWHFGKWWIILFAIIPLIAFNAHSLVIDSDIERAKED